MAEKDDKKKKDDEENFRRRMEYSGEDIAAVFQPINKPQDDAAAKRAVRDSDRP